MTKRFWSRIGTLTMAALAATAVLIGTGATPASALIQGGNSPGQITCNLRGKILFSPHVTRTGGGTGSSRVTGKVFGCSNNGTTNSVGNLSGSFSKSPLNCATVSGTGATASLELSWRPVHAGRYSTGSGPTTQYNPSVVTSTGSQIETTAGGKIGVAVPGAGSSATTAGSYSGGSATAVANLYFSDTPGALAAACNSRHGVAKLSFTGDITLSNNPQVVSEFPGAGIYFARGITSGPDGNLWFVNGGDSAVGTPTSIGRITPSGVVTTFTSSSLDNPEQISAGPDGNLWFTNEGGGGPTITDPGSIGRITSSGTISSFTDPSIDEPYGITAGPDGNLWFTNLGSHSIGQITPAGVVSNFPLPSGANPGIITTGPDGNLWFADGTSIGRITTAGAVSTFPFACSTSCDAGSITVGPDGALWFTVGYTGPALPNPAVIGRITTAGVVSEFPLPASVTDGGAITAGPDGNLWFAEGSGIVNRITPAGSVTTFIGPAAIPPHQTSAGFAGAGITAGPDGNIWFTGDGSIERITP